MMVLAAVCQKLALLLTMAISAASHGHLYSNTGVYG